MQKGHEKISERERLGKNMFANFDIKWAAGMVCALNWEYLSYHKFHEQNDLASLT
jgi:hypothetical protein